MCTEDDDTVLTRKQDFWYEMIIFCAFVLHVHKMYSQKMLSFFCLFVFLIKPWIRLDINHENTSLFKKRWMTEAQVKVDKWSVLSKMTFSQRSA